jgi:hypothetical protein
MRKRNPKRGIGTQEGKATVRVFALVMVSKLTQYDERLSRAESKRGSVNIYRLGHFLRAADETLALVPKRLRDSDSAQALHAYKSAIERKFIVSDMPPAKNVLKQIDAYLDTGKLPTIVPKKKRAAKKNPAARAAAKPRAAKLRELSKI